jgi:hypothetical protein
MKTIVELTREAGGFEPTPEFLERLVELARADERSIEREACAKVCEDVSQQFHAHAMDCAEAIRARGETK